MIVLLAAVFTEFFLLSV